MRPLMITVLAMRQPPLLYEGTGCDTDYVLRYQPAKVVHVPGAPVAFAPHLRWTTLPRVPLKHTLIQFAKGDLAGATANLSQVALAANLREMTSVYRYDLARAVVPALAEMNAHYYLFPMGSPAEIAIALAAQQQIVAFFASEDWAVPDVNGMLRPLFGKDLFETPAMLPEDLGW